MSRELTLDEAQSSLLGRLAEIDRAITRSRKGGPTSTTRLATCDQLLGRPVPARRSITSSNTFAPATKSGAGVCSRGLWLIPPTLGTKIIAAGQIRAIIWASWLAPDVMRFERSPNRPAAASTSSTMPLSKITGSKRTNRSTEIDTFSTSASSMR
jgi:hypothetical protein